MRVTWQVIICPHQWEGRQQAAVISINDQYIYVNILPNNRLNRYPETIFSFHEKYFPVFNVIKAFCLDINDSLCQYVNISSVRILKKGWMIAFAVTSSPTASAKPLLATIICD
jgi:hypothetical protein